MMKQLIETDCYECNVTTHHKALFVKQVESKFVDNHFLFYMVVECGGCKTISFVIREPLKKVSPDEDQFIDFNYPTEEDLGYEDYNFLKPEDQNRLPKKINELYEEIKLVFSGDSNVFAGVGLRMLIEAICINQKISGSNLQQKIKNLHGQGMISSSELPILDKLRLIGNDSAHKIKSFSMNNLGYALDIINHVLRSIYILPKINRMLKL